MSASTHDIAERLRQRIIDQIRGGTLEYGDRLPSARELAVELDADPRTVLAAYHVLAEEELVELRRRSGVYVAARAVPSRALVAPPVRWLVDTLADAISRDIPVPTLAQRVDEATGTIRTRAAVLECNRDQIHSMSRELSEDYGLLVDGIDLDSFDHDGELPPALQRADLIVTGAHGDTVRPLAERLGKPCVVIAVRPDLLERTYRLLARGRVYFIVTDPRFAEKLRRLFAPLPGSENFRAIVLGRDDVRSIPADATTYVMRLALENLRGVAIPGRVVPPVRIFSPACAREILSVIVRRNVTAAAVMAEPPRG